MGELANPNDLFNFYAFQNLTNQYHLQKRPLEAFDGILVRSQLYLLAIRWMNSIVNFENIQQLIAVPNHIVT